jgi:hypothetical protein
MHTHIYCLVSLTDNAYRQCGTSILGYYSAIKERLCICENMCILQGHNAKRNMPYAELKIQQNLSYRCHLKWPNMYKQKGEWWLPGTGRWGKMGDSDQSIPSCSYVE